MPAELTTVTTTCTYCEATDTPCIPVPHRCSVAYACRRCVDRAFAAVPPTHARHRWAEPVKGEA